MKLSRPSPAEIVLHGGEEIKEWREDHKVKIPGAEYSPTHKRQGGWWDGYTRPGKAQYLGNKRWRLRLTRGFLPVVREGFPKADEEVGYEPLELPGDWTDLAGQFLQGRIGKLRDYQREALDLIFEHRWGRIALATNAGKGAIIGIAAACLEERGLNSVVLCDEKSVFQALEEEIVKWGGTEPHLVEAGRDQPPPDDAGVVLAMVPTLHRRLGTETDDTGEPRPDKYHPEYKAWREWLGGVRMALLDEADRATADRWKEVCSFLENSSFRVGFSGSFDTASEDDEMAMLELMGPVLSRLKNIELIERGISARPTVELIPYIQDLPQPSPSSWWDMSGPERRRWAYENGVVYNEHRHEFVRDLLPEDEQAALVVRRVDHGQELERYLDGSFFLYGEHSREERDAVLEQFEAGEFRYLIVTSIVDRGTNRLAPVRHIFYVSGEGSQTQQLQRCGRGLRKWEDKEEVRFVDIIDRPPAGAGGRLNPYKYFANSGGKRIDLYNRENFVVRVRDV